MRAMKSMIFHRSGERLNLEVVADPEPGPGQILIRVEACGVCRTDLHIIDGDLKHPKLPLIPGHEIVGHVVRWGAGVNGFKAGMWVGVPWLGSTCGSCSYCLDEEENLCDFAAFTGYDLTGGYAEYCTADARYCFQLDPDADPALLAPLMCAGLIGYRALRLAGEAGLIGIYGFGAAAHLLAQVAAFDNRDIYAFTRAGDADAQKLALGLAGMAELRSSISSSIAALSFPPSPEGKRMAMGLSAASKLLTNTQSFGMALAAAFCSRNRRIAS